MEPQAAGGGIMAAQTRTQSDRNAQKRAHTAGQSAPLTDRHRHHSRSGTPENGFIQRGVCFLFFFVVFPPPRSDYSLFFLCFGPFRALTEFVAGGGETGLSAGMTSEAAVTMPVEVSLSDRQPASGHRQHAAAVSAGAVAETMVTCGSGALVLPAGFMNPSVPIRNIKMKFAVLAGLIQVGQVGNRDIVETVLNLVSLQFLHSDPQNAITIC